MTAPQPVRMDDETPSNTPPTQAPFKKRKVRDPADSDAWRQIARRQSCASPMPLALPSCLHPFFLDGNSLATTTRCERRRYFLPHPFDPFNSSPRGHAVATRACSSTTKPGETSWVCLERRNILRGALRTQEGQLSADELDVEGHLGHPKKMRINMSGRAAPEGIQPAGGFAYSAAASHNPQGGYAPPRMDDPNATDDSGDDDDDGSPPMGIERPQGMQQWGEQPGASSLSEPPPPLSISAGPSSAPSASPYLGGALAPAAAAPKPSPKPPAPKKPRLPQPSKSLSKKASYQITAGEPTQKDIEEIIARLAKCAQPSRFL